MGQTPLLCCLAVLMPVAAGAADPFGDCDRQVTQAPAARESYRCYYVEARRTGGWPAARNRLESYLDDRPGVGWVLLALANLESDQGRDRAESLYRSAMEAFRVAGRADGEVYARIGQATYLAHRGRADEADRELESAAGVAEASGDSLLRTISRVEIARQLWRKGEETGRAYRVLREVEASGLESAPYQLRLSVLNTLGALAAELNRLDEALRFRLRLLDLVHQAGDRYVEATARANALNTMLDRLDESGQPIDAAVRSFAEETLGLARQVGNRWIEAAIHRRLGDLTGGSEAIEHGEFCLEIARQLGEPEGIGSCLRGLAACLTTTDPVRALALLDEADEVAEKATSFRVERVQAGLVRSHVLWELGRTAEATTESLALLDRIETLRELELEEAARAGLFSAWIAAYYRLVGRLLEDGARDPATLELAFRVSERMRSRNLLDNLHRAGASPKFVPPAGLLDRRSPIVRRIAEVQRRLGENAVADAERRASRDELESLEREEAAVRAEWVRLDRKFARLHQLDLATLAELQARLAPDQALLSFQVFDRRRGDGVYQGGSWVWTVTPGRVEVRALPDRRQLKESVALFLGLLERRDGSDRSAAASLYTDVLRDALASLSPTVTRLVVVPDGPLHSLPFAALRQTPEAPPLAERFTWVAAPSATLWMRLSGARAAAPGPAAPGPAALAFGDPQEAQAPAETEETAQVARAEKRTVAEIARPEARLSHARTEALLVGRTFGELSRTMLGSEASEKALKSIDLRPYRLLHFASHARIDEQRPERSAVLLAPGGPEEDGLVQARDIVGLDLADRVIVLAACRSASGTVLPGEGVVGLANAFFQAGARTVVGSLRPVRDDEAGEFVRLFYRQLARGNSLSGALAAAQRQSRRSGSPTASWSTWVVLGDGDGEVVPRAAAGDRSLLAATLAVIVGAAVLAGWFGWRRRGRVGP